jgi:uncharacterized protein
LDEVESPCISICKMNPDTGYCIGCWRSRSEIKGWSEASSEARWKIISNMHKRRKAARAMKPITPLR